MSDTSNGKIRISRREGIIWGLGAAAAGGLVGRLPETGPADQRLKKEDAYSLGTTVHATDHGVIADGLSDDSAALNRAIEIAAAEGSVLLLPALRTIAISEPLSIPTNAYLDMNGATLLSTVKGDRASVQILGQSNIVIRNGRIDGTKEDAEVGTEWRHGLALLGSSHVRLEDLTLSNHLGDGIYIGAGSAPAAGERNISNSDVTLDRVSCEGNYRQGMSIITVAGLYVSNSSFTGTKGTHPQSGVDLEPNTDDEILTDVFFNGCTFSDNAGSGLVISTRAEPRTSQTGHTFVGCRFEGNMDDGIYLHNAEGATFVGAVSTSNGGAGLKLHSTMPGASRRLNFTSAEFADNKREGVLATGAFEDLAFLGCQIENNGIDAVLGNSSFDADFNPTEGSSDLRFIGNRIGGEHHSGSLRVNSKVTNTMLVGNQIAGGSESSTLQDEAGSRIDISSHGSHLAQIVKVTTSNATSPALDVGLANEEFSRLVISPDEVRFGDGAIEPDVNIYRGGRNTLKTDNTFIASGGLGIGNSKVGQALGVLTRSFEIFDDKGRSLGFIPIYNSIR